MALKFLLFCLLAAQLPAQLTINKVTLQQGGKEAKVSWDGNLKVECAVGCSAGEPASNYALEAGGNLASILDRLPAALASHGGLKVEGIAGGVAVPISGTFWQATQPVSGTFWQATQPVSGTVAVSNWPVTQPVSGTFFQATQPVSGTFFQATQPVSGTVTATNSNLDVALSTRTKPADQQHTIVDSGVVLPAALGANGGLKVEGIAGGVAQPVSGTFFQATQPVSGAFFQATQPVSGTFWQATQPVSGTVAVSNFPGTQPVSGTFWQGTQPVSGTVTVSNDGTSATGSAVPAKAAYIGGNDGSNLQGLKTVSAANLTATTAAGVLMTVPLGNWTIVHRPATATKATISKGSGGGSVRHVATGFTVCLAVGATLTGPVNWDVIDGASGGSTRLWTGALSGAVNTSNCHSVSGLSLIGTAATAMTIEFAAAGATASLETVSLSGYSVP